MPACCRPDPHTGPPLDVRHAPPGEFGPEAYILCVYANPPSLVCQTPDQTGCLPGTRFEAHPISSCSVTEVPALDHVGTAALAGGLFLAALWRMRRRPAVTRARSRR